MARLVRCRHCGHAFRREASLNVEIDWLLAGSIQGCRRCGHDVEEPPPRGGWTPPEVVDGKPGKG